MSCHPRKCMCKSLICLESAHKCFHMISCHFLLCSNSTNGLLASVIVHLCECVSAWGCEVVGLFQWKEFSAAPLCNSSLPLFKTQQDANMNVGCHKHTHTHRHVHTYKDALSQMIKYHTDSAVTIHSTLWAIAIKTQAQRTIHLFWDKRK